MFVSDAATVVKLCVFPCPCFHCSLADDRTSAGPAHMVRESIRKMYSGR
jgi:hypothetical protein